MNIDWNPVIHILDKLSEGTHSLLELSYMAVHYERPAFLESLLFLADQELVELGEWQETLVAISKAAWPLRLRDVFGVDVPDQKLMAETSIDLTKNGEQILRLLNVGHPPLSGSGNVL